MCKCYEHTLVCYFHEIGVGFCLDCSPKNLDNTGQVIWKLPKKNMATLHCLGINLVQSVFTRIARSQSRPVIGIHNRRARSSRVVLRVLLVVIS